MSITKPTTIRFTLQGEREMKALRIAQVATSGKDDPRYYLQGVLIDAANTEADGNMPLVGTNGHMLVKNMIKLIGAEGIEENQQYIFMIDGAIPKYAYTAHFNWYTDPTKASTVSFWRMGGKKAMATRELTRFECKYPNYQRLFDTVNDENGYGNHAHPMISFNPEYLGRLAAAVADKTSTYENVGDGIKLEFGLKPDSSMKVHFFALPEAEVILMPMRLPE